MARNIAAAASRKLRAANINVSPAGRANLHPGIYVTGAFGTEITVMVDDMRNQAKAVTQVIDASRTLADGDVDVHHSEDGRTAWVSFTYAA